MTTLATALVVAVVCLVVLATTGQSAAAEEDVVAHIDSLGSRLVVAFDQTGDAHIQAASVADVAALDQVSWAMALGAVTDVRNADSHGDERVASRSLFGELPAALPLILGREPQPGEAVVGREAATALGLRDGVGIITDGTQAWPVVGVFRGAGPLSGLDSNILVRVPPGAGGAGDARYVYAEADDVSSVDVVRSALPALLRAQQPSAITVEEPSGILALRAAIAGDLGRSSRLLMVLVLTVGLAIVVVTTFAQVAARRRDFGRRRALGATRSAIVVLVLVQTAAAGLAGALLGTGGGLALVHALSGRTPDVTFTASIAVLAVLLAVSGSVPPALLAAHRDPVRILRVP